MTASQAAKTEEKPYQPRVMEDNRLGKEKQGQSFMPAIGKPSKATGSFQDCELQKCWAPARVKKWLSS